MKKYVVPVLALLASSLGVFAQEAIKVDRVDFNSLRDDWVQVAIELSCDGNPAEDARDKDYVEKIKVKVYLGYTRDQSANEYDYYTSELEIIIMEKGDDNNVYFYLPGQIVERDSLKERPDYYYVEVSVNGEPQKPQKTAMSSNIPNLDILKSFVTNADSKGAENDYMLMPIYLTSGIDLGRVSDLPAFLRREMRD